MILWHRGAWNVCTFFDCSFRKNSASQIKIHLGPRYSPPLCSHSFPIHVVRTPVGFSILETISHQQDFPSEAWEYVFRVSIPQRIPTHTRIGAFHSRELSFQFKIFSSEDMNGHNFNCTLDVSADFSRGFTKLISALVEKTL